MRLPRVSAVADVGGLTARALRAPGRIRGVARKLTGTHRKVSTEGELAAFRDGVRFRAATFVDRHADAARTACRRPEGVLLEGPFDPCVRCGTPAELNFAGECAACSGSDAAT